MKVIQTINARQFQLFMKHLACCHQHPHAGSSNRCFFHKHAIFLKENTHHFSPFASSFYSLSQKPDHADRTTFADAKPVEVEGRLLSQVLMMINQETRDSNPLNSKDFSGSTADSAKFVYPLRTSRSGLSNRKDFFTAGMTFAGKRFYSSKGSPSDSYSESNKDEDLKNVESESKTAQLKRVFAIYGTFGIVFHIIMSLGSLGLMYLLVSSGIDVIGLLGKMGIELSSVAAGASTMVVAYAIHKLILPIRATITIVSVPVLVRYLRKAGYLKK